MKLFELRRREDESGISGTGTEHTSVATSVAFYTSIAEVTAIHGHGGKTKVVQIADCDMAKVNPLCANCAQDYCEGILCDFRSRNHKYMWEQRDKFVDLFIERDLA